MRLAMVELSVSIDKTMTEVKDLCDYLDLNFADYFGEYQPPKAEAMFTGNY